MRLRLSLLLVLVVSLAALAQEGQPSPEDMQKMMAEYIKMGAPGPQHEKLAALTGEWVSHVKMWRAPNAEPMETPPGTHKGEMILGGRFLQFRETGDMMGHTMEGIGLLGYDKNKDQYQMLWIDNTATAMYTANGTADESGKTLTLQGRLDDISTGQMDKKVKYIYYFDSPNQIRFEIWDSLPNGEFFRTMETTYTRK